MLFCVRAINKSVTFLRTWFSDDLGLSNDFGRYFATPNRGQKRDPNGSTSMPFCNPSLRRPQNKYTCPPSSRLHGTTIIKKNFFCSFPERVTCMNVENSAFCLLVRKRELNLPVNTTWIRIQAGQLNYPFIRVVYPDLNPGLFYIKNLCLLQ